MLPSFNDACGMNEDVMNVRIRFDGVGRQTFRKKKLPKYLAKKKKLPLANPGKVPEVGKTI